MRIMQRLSLRGKLIVLGMLSTSVAMLDRVHDFPALRLSADEEPHHQRVEDDDAYRRGGRTAAVSFDDSDAAAVTLHALGHPARAAVGRGLQVRPANCSPDTNAAATRAHSPPSPASRAFNSATDSLTYGSPSLLDGKQIGWVYTHSDLHELHEHMTGCLLVILLILAVTLAGTLCAGRVPSAGHFRPILSLTGVARSVSAARITASASGRPRRHRMNWAC